MGFSYAKALEALAPGQTLIVRMVKRPDRPCDGCGRRTRCAPNKRFGGLLCGPCAVRIATAEQKLTQESGLIRRGATQFAGYQPALEPCSVRDLRALERTYREFRREPTPAARESLIAAINARCNSLPLKG